MTRFIKHLLTVGCLIFFSLPFAAVSAKNHSNILLDTVEVSGSTAMGNVGDLVAVNVTVTKCNDIVAFSLPITWDTAFLTLQSTSNYSVALTNFTNANLNGVAADGKVWLTWSNNIGHNVPDNSTLVRLNFRIKKYSYSPLKIKFLDATGIVPAFFQQNFQREEPYYSNFGQVRVNNNGQNQILTQSLTCATASPLCPQFTSFYGTTPLPNDTRPRQGTLCTFSVENNVWHSFTAGSTSLTFRFAPNNCNSPQGIQIAIYETNDCVVFNSLDCIRQVNEDFQDSIVLTNLIIGKTYYILIDGYDTAICDYNIRLVSGALAGNTNNANLSVSGNGIVCSTTPENYAVVPVVGAVKYEWRLASDATIVGSSTTPSVQIRFGTVSDSVCARVIGVCDTSRFFCKKVTVSQNKSRDTTVRRCFGDCYRFDGQDRCTAGTFRGVFQTVLGCDSVVNLTLEFYPAAIRSIDTVLCAGTSLIVGSQTIRTSGTYQEVIARGSAFGCDSTINVDVQFIDFQLNTSKSNDISCATRQATLTALVSNILPAGATSSISWTTAGGAAVGSAPSVVVTQGGTYTATVSVTFRGKTCEKTATITVGQSGDVPTRPELRGPTLGCFGSTAIFMIANPQANVIRYNWTPTNARLSIGLTQVTVTEWLPNNTTARVCVNAENGCGTSDTTCLSVSLLSPPTPLSISGFTSLCPHSSTTFNVSSGSSATSFQWSATNGATIESGQNTRSATIRFTNQNSTITLTPSNACGIGQSTTLDITIKNQLPDSLPISGSTAVCSNDTTVFSIANNADITNYQWILPSGAFILSGQNSNSIRVDWAGFVGNGQITLITKNACDLSRTVTYNVTVRRASFTTPLISGPAVICPFSEATYSILADTSFVSYQWTLPLGATIVSGQGTNSIVVNTQNAMNGQISVSIRNSCGTVRTSRLNIEIRATLDSLTVDGRTMSVCRGDTASFFVPSDRNVQVFQWQVLGTGSRIVSGQGTSRILVQFGSVNTVIQVTPNGGCSDGIRSRLGVQVKLPPNITGGIVGTDWVCENALETYSVARQDGVIGYTWQVPNGARIIGDSIGRTVNINFGTANGGFVVVQARGECGYGDTIRLPINFIQKPIVNAGIDDTICGLRSILRGSQNGQVRQWTAINAPLGGRATLANPTDAQTDVTVTLAGVYTFKYEEYNGGCGRADSVTIVFRPTPTLTLLEETCNREATEYRVRFSVPTGSAPFSIVGGTNTGGVFTQSVCLSNPIANATNYSFVVSDAYGCKTDTLKGFRECPCFTTAGTMVVDSLVVCFGANGQARHRNNAQLDGNDTHEFLLHNGTRTALGTTILAKNQTGLFNFNAATMQFNTVYYIAYVVGDSAVGGGVNRNNRCTALTEGIPIIFKNQVMASLKGDTTVCQGEPVLLRFTATQNTVFNISYRESPSGFIRQSNIQNGGTIQVAPSVSSTFSLISATDLFGCTASFTDSMRVNHKPQPTANAGVDQNLCSTSANLDAAEDLSFVGTWTSTNPRTTFGNVNNARTTVTNLQNGQNALVWTVRDPDCPLYLARDTVFIFVPLSPEAQNLAYRVFQRDTVKGNVSLSAPVGSYTVTRITNPASGRFDLFSNGSFTYIPDTGFVGIIKFSYVICSDQCSRLCDTGEVRILYERRVDTAQKVSLNIPNAITPNDDGKNDRWIIDGLDKYPDNEVLIFNRWGDVLYRVKSYQNDWEGTNSGGQPLPEGTYYYAVRLNVNDGKIYKGDITILR